LVTSTHPAPPKLSKNALRAVTSGARATNDGDGVSDDVRLDERDAASFV
jgi:hypothetical protein